MTSKITLDSSVKYSGASQSVHWEGRSVDNVNRFKDYLRNVVRPRITDQDSSFDADLRSLATTEMDTRFIENLLSTVPEPKHWEVGEAFAECALQDDAGRQVHWPWNTVRDRRTPRASLPGADLVGFYCDEQQRVFLLFGEVKTSSDGNTPPKVVYGKGGMMWQLEQNAKRLDVQYALLQWLQARCRSQIYRSFFKEATRRYIKSHGKELVFAGVLIRDTTPNEFDLDMLKSRLLKRIENSTRIELIAWYLPIPIADWPALLQDLA